MKQNLVTIKNLHLELENVFTLEILKIVFWYKYFDMISSPSKPNIALFMSCVTKYISCLNPQNFSWCISSAAQTPATQSRLIIFIFKKIVLCIWRKIFFFLPLSFYETNPFTKNHPFDIFLNQGRFVGRIRAGGICMRGGGGTV